MRHIRGTMRTVNDGLGYWPVMRLLEAGLAGQGMLPRTFHLGERAFGFAERKRRVYSDSWRIVIIDRRAGV